MKCTLKSDHPVTNEAAKAATGKTLDQWFANWTSRTDSNRAGAPTTTTCTSKKSTSGGAPPLPSNTNGTMTFARRTDCLRATSSARQKLSRAPPAEVFKAWSSAAELSKWFGAGTKAEVKDGGTYQNKDGDKGKFLRVRQNKDIRMTFENPAFSSPTKWTCSFRIRAKARPACW